ncbi:restriction endonuclease [Winogradskyella arenosi]|uniref:Restriction endonuclease n=1 Tax=Winogradskyella arenosi TaxID=533325 RepID=A0A368ZGN7_9FLAO|nr:restriction endonuclease [Winogradskyella arenosi]RCW92009.1 restriction endonuclease [Winogradskyella arenosi]
MSTSELHIIKSSGEKALFSVDKLRNSLAHTGADTTLIETIIAQVNEELYPNISTREIYNRAFALLKKNKSHLASKYKLKKAIYELGPTGFPFERFVSAILDFSGYSTKIGQILKGKCVSHEVDITATKNDETTVIECKFHSEQGPKCNVKIPLYIHSRFQDIKANWPKIAPHKSRLMKGWVVTNTRFTKDALQYGKCCGLYLLSWDYPSNNGLKDRIDRLGLYPITVSTLLSQREKQFLLSRTIVLCKDLINDKFYLDHLGISEPRKSKILNEITHLCL